MDNIENAHVVLRMIRRYDPTLCPAGLVDAKRRLALLRGAKPKGSEAPPVHPLDRSFRRERWVEVDGWVCAIAEGFMPLFFVRRPDGQVTSIAY
jgi:hypothetical protein